MVISQIIYDNICKHALTEAPVEACGLLLGKDNQVTKHILMTNADAREDHFSFIPEEQLRAYKEADRTGLQILGVYHSHPSAPAWPSPEDIRLAYDRDIVYLIVSLIECKNKIRAFNIIEGKVIELPLTIKLQN